MEQKVNGTKQIGISSGSWCNHYVGRRFAPVAAGKAGWRDLSMNAGGRFHYGMPHINGAWGVEFDADNNGCCRAFLVFLYARVTPSGAVVGVSFTLGELFADGRFEPREYPFGLAPWDMDTAREKLDEVTEIGKVN